MAIVSPVISEWRFQSTPPVKVATGIMDALSDPRVVSIHATCEGGDACSIVMDLDSGGFNPRHL